tara:strand:- start:6703 stop:7113 length:411 start_codon:yes stop_codon:yes gene_type:complete
MLIHRSYRNASDTTDVNILDGYDADKFSTLDLNPGGNILARISGITVQLKSLTAAAGGGGLPTSLTMRITRDITGDSCVITDTISSIAPGVTTATSGTADYKADVDVALVPAVVYVFCKTNTGTAIVDSVTITYEQ